jgi:hypothetical protein
VVPSPRQVTCYTNWMFCGNLQLFKVGYSCFLQILCPYLFLILCHIAPVVHSELSDKSRRKEKVNYWLYCLEHLRVKMLDAWWPVYVGMVGIMGWTLGWDGLS